MEGSKSLFSCSFAVGTIRPPPYPSTSSCDRVLYVGQIKKIQVPSQLIARADELQQQGLSYMRVKKKLVDEFGEEAYAQNKSKVCDMLFVCRLSELWVQIFGRFMPLNQVQLRRREVRVALGV